MHTFVRLVQTYTSQRLAYAKGIFESSYISIREKLHFDQIKSSVRDLHEGFSVQLSHQSVY